jgi:hypothetical protein
MHSISPKRALNFALIRFLADFTLQLRNNPLSGNPTYSFHFSRDRNQI